MTPDQEENLRMLRDSAAAVAPRDGGLQRIRGLRFQVPGFDRAVWRQMCEMGWIGLRIPEADGGAGLGMTEFCAIAEELAGGLVPEPLVACASAARVLRGDDLASVLAGEQIVIPAWQERADTLGTGTGTNIRDGRVTGRKMFVAMPAGADAFLVAGQGGLAIVASDAAGVHVDLAQTQDGGHFGTLTLADAPARAVPGDFCEAIEEATLLTAASLLGVMERSFALTLEYLRTRKQFGRPIGSFQALQHRCADLNLQIALTRASVGSAATLIDAGASAADCQAAVSRAKVRASEAAMLVTREGIQLHGGIGYTDEYDAGLYLRKAMVLSNMFGSARLHRARFAATMREPADD